MKTSETIYLTSFVSPLTGISPFTLTINPSGIEETFIGYSDKKTYKIVYDFGDGTVETQYAGLEQDSEEVSSHIKTHTYYIKDTSKTNFRVAVSFYQINREDPIEYTCNLNLSIPSLEATSSVNGNNMFDSVHLVGTRMFGVDNNILYLFQGTNPDYLLPAIVNWSSKELVLDEIEEVVREFLPGQRAFQLLMPFENEKFTSIDLGAKIESTNRVSYLENPDNAEL